jgi:hypothetical protein
MAKCGRAGEMSRRASRVKGRAGEMSRRAFDKKKIKRKKRKAI